MRIPIPQTGRGIASQNPIETTMREGCHEIIKEQIMINILPTSIMI